MFRFRKTIFLLCLALFACAPQPTPTATLTATPIPPTITPTAPVITATNTLTPTIEASATPEAVLNGKVPISWNLSNGYVLEMIGFFDPTIGKPNRDGYQNSDTEIELLNNAFDHIATNAAWGNTKFATIYTEYTKNLWLIPGFGTTYRGGVIVSNSLHSNDSEKLAVGINNVTYKGIDGTAITYKMQNGEYISVFVSINAKNVLKHLTGFAVDVFD